MRADPEVWRYIGAEPDGSVAETALRLDLLAETERKHGYTLWAVEEKESGALVGDCGLIPLEGTGPEVELGYRLARVHWGKGYATEAASAVRDLGFGRFGLERIYVEVHPENAASQAVARKLGARLLGPATHLGAPVLRFLLEPPKGVHRG